MAFRQSLQTSFVALALGVGFSFPAAAQIGYQAQPYHQSVQPMVRLATADGSLPEVEPLEKRG